MAARVQLEGAITFDATNYSADITSFVLNLTRPVTQVPGTFADADGTQVLGSQIGTLTITFNHDEGDAAGFWAEAYAAQQSDSGELAFTALLRDAVVGVTNPMYSGTVLINDLDIGGQVGELKAQTKTWPVYGVTQTTA